MACSVILAVALETARQPHRAANHLFLKTFSPVLKQTEDSEVTGASHFVIAAFFTFYFFGEDGAIPVLLFQAVGTPLRLRSANVQRDEATGGSHPWVHSPSS